MTSSNTRLYQPIDNQIHLEENIFNFVVITVYIICKHSNDPAWTPYTTNKNEIKK